MRLRSPFAGFCLVMTIAFPGVGRGATDADYAALTKRIFDRVGALKDREPKLDWSEEIKRARVEPDGSGTFSIERGVSWVLDRPTERPSKLNGSRPAYQPGGFWIHLTFYRGAWKGAAAFYSIDFGDLHLWFDYGYKDDATAITAVARIVEEERRAFEKTFPPGPSAPNQPAAPAGPKNRG